MDISRLKAVDDFRWTCRIKYKYGSRNFWCGDYYLDTVGRNKRVIAEYIKNQLEEDFAEDQISLKEYMDLVYVYQE